MLDETGLPLDLPEQARAELALAGAAWEDEPRAEAHVRAAVAVAPDALAAHLGAYKFYLYRHRLEDALPHAAIILSMAAQRLQLPHDWRDVAAHHAAFDRIEPWPRLFLQALIGTGYALARLGRLIEAHEALSKAASLDAADRFGVGRLIQVIERGGAEEDEDV